MSKKTRLIAGGALLAAVAVLVFVVAMSSMDHGDDGGDATSSEVDGAFITGMVPHHESAVDMAETALKKADRSEIKQLAQDIVRTQTDEIEQLTASHERLFDEPLPADGKQHGDLGLSEGQMGMHGDVSMLEGADEFDREFIDMMIPHHQGAIRMARAELERGEDNEMKDLARMIIDAQAKEIVQMNEWRTEWYGEASPAGGVPAKGEAPKDSSGSHEGMGH